MPKLIDKPCGFCKGRAYTKKPVTITTLNGRKDTVVIDYCPVCGRYLREIKSGKKPSTNADRIRHMTDEELAELLDNIGSDCDTCSMNPSQCDYECYQHKLEWLKQEGDQNDSETV